MDRYRTVFRHFIILDEYFNVACPSEVAKLYNNLKVVIVDLTPPTPTQPRTQTMNVSSSGMSNGCLLFHYEHSTTLLTHSANRHVLVNIAFNAQNTIIIHKIDWNHLQYPLH